jgi:hypothetical protein
MPDATIQARVHRQRGREQRHGAREGAYDRTILVLRGEVLDMAGIEPDDLVDVEVVRDGVLVLRRRE